jgi:cyclophilin family peptidyl-prolyl cis-trans isomerase
MKNNYNEQSDISVDGHCVIKDVDTGEILLDKHNAINFQNFAFAVSNLLANKSENGNQFFIDKIAFGYGGTVIDANGNITYKNPQVDGVNGALYNPLLDGSSVAYAKQVSSIDVVDTESNPYSDITVKVVLDYDEPTTAPTLDNAQNFDDPTSWVIDEIALVTESGYNLTHLIFHPIQKAKNRKIEILYSLRIRAGV